MITFLRRLFHRRPRVIDVETFGPRLGYGDLSQLIATHPEVVKAVLQVCVYRRQLCHRAVEDKSNCLAGQTSFESGGASSLSDLMLDLIEVREGRADTQLRSFFPEATK